MAYSEEDRAIWGFGFYFGKNNDSKDDFIAENYVSIKYSQDEAPEFIEMMKEVKTGDIVYLKSWAIRCNVLHIWAIGEVVAPFNPDNMRIGVKWIVKDINKEVIPNKRYRQRVASIYKEYNKEIAHTVIELLNNTDSEQ